MLGYGNPDAELVIVGEAPGALEQSEGKPFIGPSGRLVRQTLDRLGVSWDDTYRTNTLLCMPPKQVGQRALKACAPRLAGELDALTHKRVILCVGSHAVSAIRGKPSAITKLNGTAEWNERYQCWAVYAYHPAFILRSADAYDEFMWAVARAAKLTLQPDYRPEPLPALPFIVAAKNVWPIRFGVEDASLIVCDLETSGLNPRRDKILEIGLRWRGKPPLVIPGEYLNDYMWRAWFESLYARTGVTWVYHNGKFDVQFLQAAGLDARVSADTMLMHHALDERSGQGDDGGWSGGHHDLKTLARYYVNWPDWSEEVDELLKERKSMALIPPETRRPYLAYDLEATWQLYHVFRKRLAEQPDSREGYMTPADCHERIVIPAANAVARIEARGIRVDRERLEQLAVEYDERAEAATARTRQHANRPNLNPRSPLQVAGVLYSDPEVGGLGYLNRRKTDILTLHELQLDDERAGMEPHPFLASVIETRSLKHTKSLYINGIRARLDRNDRVHTNLLLHGTVTGRLASRNPNLQNIPADSVIKELFIPSPGMVMINADYKQLEVRVLALYSRDPELCKALRADDYHWEVCKVSFPAIVAALTGARDTSELDAVARMTPMFDEFARRQASPQRTDDFDTLFDWLKTRLRRKSKYVTFGNIYGEGAEALSRNEKGLGCTVKEAERFQANWRKRYAVAAAWLDRQTTLAKRDGWVESFTGRRRRFREAFGGRSSVMTESRNHPVQAGASDINTISLTRLETQLPNAKLGYALLPVHDSVLSEVDENRVDEAVTLIHSTMTTVINDPDVFFDIDLATGRSWGKLRKQS